MSVILIEKHNESIYNISKDMSADKKIPPKVDTNMGNNLKLRREIQKQLKKKKKSHGTMGLPKQPPMDPHKYLRKGGGHVLTANLDEDIKANKEEAKRLTAFRKLPKVPARDDVIKEMAAKIKHRSKNYLAENIKAALTMPPKKPARRVVIAPDGVTRDLSAGLEPQNLTTKVFGKIPPYLDTLIKIKQSAMEREMDLRGAKHDKCLYITREERSKLLSGLKQNWEELQRVYQGLPILTDTIPKIHRKSKLEADLKQLEKDIVLIERHPYIYVYEDENDM